MLERFDSFDPFDTNCDGNVPFGHLDHLKSFKCTPRKHLYSLLAKDRLLFSRSNAQTRHTQGVGTLQVYILKPKRSVCQMYEHKPTGSGQKNGTPE